MSRRHICRNYRWKLRGFQKERWTEPDGETAEKSRTQTESMHHELITFSSHVGIQEVQKQTKEKTSHHLHTERPIKKEFVCVCVCDQHSVRTSRLVSHHVMRPAATADQVTQQEFGFLLSSSSSLRQQHRQLR